MSVYLIAVKQTFGITDMVLRDVRCSILATRVGVEDMLPITFLARSGGFYCLPFLADQPIGVAP